MTYQRKLFSTLLKQISTPEIIALTGMRRVGKTTLYRSIFDNIPSSNKLFLDIENPLDQKIFEELDYNNIWSNLVKLGLNNQEKAYIFLDEIQAVPEITKSIKYLFDHYGIKFFLTGSSSFYLRNLFPESLAGRKIIFELFPLDFEEFLTFKSQSSVFYDNFSDKDIHKNLISHTKRIKLYEEYLQYGGFPRVVVENNIEQKKLVLIDIFKSYYEQDIKGLSDFNNLNSVRDLILLLIQRVGSKIDVSKLASELKISRITVNSYLSFLEASYFISTISPFSKNVDKEISGSKKVYICDTGILNQIGQVSSGSIFENAVYNNLKKFGDINYYQKRTSQQEIDFIVNKSIAVEAKSKSTTKCLDNLVKLSNNLKLSEYYIISQEFVDLDKTISATDL